jgi:LacI family transcriptional regulator
MRAESERGATTDAFRSLIELGHRRIAYLARVERDEGYLGTLQRFRMGCLAACLREAGSAVDGSLVARVADEDACRGAVERLLAASPRPTALVGGAAGFTAPIVAAVNGGGLEIPRDVSLLAFNEAGWEELCRPGISVVRHDYYRVAFAETLDLVARLERWPKREPMPQFPAEFVRRGSIGPPCRRPL